MKRAPYPTPRSFIVAVVLLSAAFLLMGASFFLWFKISPSQPIDIGHAGVWWFIAINAGIMVSFEHRAQRPRKMPRIC